MSRRSVFFPVPGLSVVAIVMIMAATALAMPVAAIAQRPDASPPSGPQAENLVLRVEAGAGYQVILGPDGEPLTAELYQVRNGKIQGEDFPKLSADFYTGHHVEDLYLFDIGLSDDDVESAVTIETRVVTFAEARDAEAFVEDIYDFAVEQAQALPEAPQDLELIDDLPTHDEAITGWTGTDFYVEIATGEGQYPVPSYRFVAQVGDRVASVKIYGNSEVVSQGLAEYVLDAQLACLAADEPCQPIPFPGDVSATPVADIRGVSRS
jgi:hypothetical protein